MEFQPQTDEIFTVNGRKHTHTHTHIHTHTHTHTHTHNSNKSKSPKTQKRNIIWFNPPFSKSVSTKVAKAFLQLVTKHFPRSHNFHKIFNRNTIKVSCSCINNISKIIKGHNKKVTSKPRDQTSECSCRKKSDSLMEKEPSS